MNRTQLTVTIIGSGPDTDRIAGLLNEYAIPLLRHATYRDAEEIFVESLIESKPLVCVRTARGADVPSLAEEVRNLEVEIEGEGDRGVGEKVSLGDSVICPQIRFLFVTDNPRVRFHHIRGLLHTNIADVLPLDLTADMLIAAISRAVLCLPKSPDRLWGAGIGHNVANILMALPGAIDTDNPRAAEFVEALIELKQLGEQLEGLLIPQELSPIGKAP